MADERSACPGPPREVVQKIIAGLDDRSGLDAYGWPHDISDEEILARLLQENLKREAA